jgi:hypothetical protein
MDSAPIVRASFRVSARSPSSAAPRAARPAAQNARTGAEGLFRAHAPGVLPAQNLFAVPAGENPRPVPSRRTRPPSRSRLSFSQSSSARLWTTLPLARISTPSSRKGRRLFRPSSNSSCIAAPGVDAHLHHRDIRRRGTYSGGSTRRRDPCPQAAVQRGRFARPAVQMRGGQASGSAGRRITHAVKLLRENRTCRKPCGAFPPNPELDAVRHPVGRDGQNRLRGRGSSCPSFFHSSENGVCLIAFMGEPCPKKSTGIFSFIRWPPFPAGVAFLPPSGIIIPKA